MGPKQIRKAGICLDIHLVLSNFSAEAFSNVKKGLQISLGGCGVLTHLKSHKIKKKFKSRCSKTILVLSSMQRCFIRLYSLFISEWNSPVLKSSFENFWIKIFIYSLYPLSVFEIFLCTVFLRYIKLRDFYLLYHPQGINLVMYILWIKCYCFYWLILFLI